MNMIKLKNIVKVALLAGVLLQYYGCNTSTHEASESRAFDHTSVNDYVKKYNDSIAYSVTTANTLDQLKTVLANVHDTVSFLIPERSSQIKSFPCTNCHSKPVEQLSLGRKENERKAHWDITVIHGNDEVMNCFTCHNKSTPNELVSLTGKSISFDESFKVCNQCHSTQYKDWIGGSHGKRLGGWAPPRIINTCTSCHNPHKPAFESRWPARLNTAVKSKINPEQ